jgi:hypothetical protein
MNNKPDLSITRPDWSKEISPLKRLAAAEVTGGHQEFQNKAAASFCDIAIHAWRIQRRIGSIGNERLKRMLTQLSLHIQDQASRLP